MSDPARGAEAEDAYGFPAGLWRWLQRHPPPALHRLTRFRSPLRGPWLTSVFGLVLLVALPFVIITGLLSYIAYAPQLGQAIPGDVGWLRLPAFTWPTRPSWLYRLTQGLHVGLGLVIIPVVLAKLWSVIPRLFVWPPARSIAQVLERLSVLMLVGGILFQIVTGVLNIQYDYIFGFSFYTGHYFGAWVFIAGFLLHIVVKIPHMVTGLRSIPMREVLGTNVADTRAQPCDPDGLVSVNPGEATLSRRGALGLVGAGVLLIGVLTVGQTLGGFTRKAALLLPRGRVVSPGDFPVNKTAAAAGITAEAIGPDWRLVLRGGPAEVVLEWVAVLQAALDVMIRASLPDDDRAPAAIAVIGMGRLGGAELGYGSDADVMFVCEPATGVDDARAVKWSTSIAERVRALLGTPSVDPPLELDANLRPEGRNGPLVRTLGSYAAYYEQWAQPWEIQALLRAHAVAGDAELGQRFLRMVDKTRYPPDGVSADSVREIRRIKARIESERLPRGADPNTHTKLGRGGLADIEWTVQLLQLQHAHQVPALHNTSTLQSLDVIAAADLVPAADVELLRQAWLTATRARNALVLVRGKPTDQLPGPGRQLNAVAVAAGWRNDDGGEFLDNYLRVTRRAKAVVRKVFGS